MAGDGEKQVVVVRRKLGQLVLEQLGGGGCALAFLGDHGLRFLREELIRELSKPSLEHRSDRIDIVQPRFVEQIDIKFWDMLGLQKTVRV